MVIVKNTGQTLIEDFNWECWRYDLAPGQEIKMPMNAAKGLQRRRPEVQIISEEDSTTPEQAEVPEVQPEPVEELKPEEFTEAERKEAEAAVASGADLPLVEPVAQVPENDKRPVSRNEMRRLRKK